LEARQHRRRHGPDTIAFALDFISRRPARRGRNWSSVGSPCWAKSRSDAAHSLLYQSAVIGGHCPDGL